MHYRYIIKADGYVALPIVSEMNWIEMKEFFQSKVKKLHPKGTDTILRWGVIELINPQLMSVDDFIHFGAAIL